MSLFMQKFHPKNYFPSKIHNIETYHSDTPFTAPSLLFHTLKVTQASNSRTIAITIMTQLNMLHLLILSNDFNENKEK